MFIRKIDRIFLPFWTEPEIQQRIIIFSNIPNTMFLFSVIILLFVQTVVVAALHLSPTEMYYARGLLMSPRLTYEQRASIQNLLYVCHEKWAVKKAVEFKKFHYYKCRDILTEDLVINSKIGLLKSSKVYNGRTAFTRFSEIYVKSELLRTLTNHLSSTSCFSKRDRMRSNRTTSVPRSTSILRPVTPLCDYVKSETPTPFERSAQTEFYRNAWEYVDDLDVFTKRVIHEKYDYEFAVKNTNKRIAAFMCCSEETVRKAIIRFSDGIRQEVLCSYLSV